MSSRLNSFTVAVNGLKLLIILLCLNFWYCWWEPLKQLLDSTQDIPQLSLPNAGNRNLRPSAQLNLLSVYSLTVHILLLNFGKYLSS